MALPDRILPLCDLLLGAAHADRRFVARERDAVRRLLGDLTGAALAPDVEERLARFDPAAFDLAAAAAPFRGDPEEDRRRLLVLVAAVHDADEELDFAEDAYLRALAGALALPPDALAGLTIDVEGEAMRDSLARIARIRRGPPPPPPKGGAAAGRGD